MAKRKSKKRSKGYLLPKYQDAGDVLKTALNKNQEAVASTTAPEGLVQDLEMAAWLISDGPEKAAQERWKQQQKDDAKLLKELERRSKIEPNVFNNYRPKPGLFHANTAVDTYKKEQAAKQKLEDNTALAVAGAIGLGGLGAALTIPAVATAANIGMVGHGIHSLPNTYEAWTDPNVSAWDATGKTAWNAVDFLGAPHLLGQTLRGGKTALGTGKRVASEISNKIPNPFKFTEKSFEKYAREGRHFLNVAMPHKELAPRNALAKYIDDVRYFPQLQKRKKAINQGLEEVKKAKKEWKDYIAKPENKKALESEMKLFTKTNDRRREVKDLLSNKYGRGHSLDDSKTSMGTQFAGWLDSQGLLTKQVMLNPSLVINDEKLVNAFIENYSKAVRGVTIGNDEVALIKAKSALETTAGRGQHGYGHYQSNSDKIKDQFSTVQFPNEKGFYSDVSLNIPGVSKAKTPKEKIDIVKKTVTDFSDPAASRNIGQRTYDNQIVINPYGGDSRERFIPNEMFRRNYNKIVEVSGPIQEGRNIADPLINQKKGAIGLADATAESKYFTQISREKIAELKEYDPDIRSAISKFKDSKYSKELESLKDMLDFRLKKLDYNFPHRKASRESAVSISEIRREISLSSVFSEAEKAKIKAMLPKKSHITTLDDELGYGVSDLRSKDLQRKIRDSEDAVLKTIFGAGVAGTAAAGVGIPFVIGDALYTSPFEKMIEENNLTEEEWDKLSIEEKHELDYQWSIKNKRPQRDGSLMSDEEIKENIYKRKYQYGGPITKYQEGDEVLENIYKNYPGLKNLGEVTLKPDTSFTREKTGIGDIEYFSPTQDSVRYSNYTVPHPSIGTHGILYNPNTNTEQNIALDMLHGMSSADPKYKKLRNSLKKKILSSKFNNDLERQWKEYSSEFKENDGKEKFINNEIDGIIRGLMFEGSDKDFENARYSREANEEYLSDKNIRNTFNNIKSYLKNNKEKQNGGPISKYQQGDEVFQIPEDLMQQHRNELKLVESADGVLMKNPESTATGFYGQLFSEIKNLPEMQGITREMFAEDTALQNKIYDRRFQEGIPDKNNVSNSTVSNLNDIYLEYGDPIKEKGYTPMDLSGIINLLGRQGTREFLGYHVRDKKPLSEVFPDKYGKGKKQANHTPDEYIEKMKSIRPDNLKNYNYDTQTYTNNTISNKGVFDPNYKPFPLQVPYDFMNPDTLNKEGIMEMQKALLDEGYYLGASGDNKDGVDGGMGNRTRTAYEDMLNNLGIEIDEKGDVGILQKAQDIISEGASGLYDFFMSDDEKEPERLPSIITNKGDTLRGEDFDNYIGKPGAYERALEKATKKEHGAEVDSVISMLEDMHGTHDNLPKYQDELEVKNTTVDLGNITYDTLEDAATPSMHLSTPVTSHGFNSVKGNKVILPGKGEEIPVTTEQMTEPIKVTGSDGKSKILEPGVVEKFKTPVLEEKLSPLDAFLKAKEEYGGLKTIKPSDKKSTSKSKNTSRKPVKMDSFGNVY